jgi:hypothetical protein
MSASYRHCAECGKRALSIATRCPGCGRELPSPAVPDHPAFDLGPLRSPPVIVGLLAIAVALGGIRLEQRASTAAGAGEESSFVPPARAAAHAVEPLAVVPLAATPTVRRPAATAPTAERDTSRVLVARTWTHVRSRRSPKAELSAVLLPGDTVLGDSLSKGWYRVALEGEVMGYAYRAGLAEVN